MKYKIYQVGGSVRDEICGKIPDDLDYVIVAKPGLPASEVFATVQWELESEGYVIFSTRVDDWMIRTKFPRNHANRSKIGDFQLAARDGYTCTLEENLRDRDLTINAIAKSVDDGTLIDYFGGLQDLENYRLACPVSAQYSLNNNPIRLIRFLRFCFIDRFDISIGSDIEQAIESYDLSQFSSIDLDRLCREMRKMFSKNSMAALLAFEYLSRKNPQIWSFIFSNIKLNPSIKAKE